MEPKKPNDVISSSNRPQQSQGLRWVSFGVYEPQGSCDIHDAVAHMARVAALLEKKSNIKVAILKSLQHSWAAVFAVSIGESDTDNRAMLNLPEAAAFTKCMDCTIKIVDLAWFRQNSQKLSRGVPCAQSSLSDIVSLRRMYISSWNKQDLLSYCYLAVLKSYYSGLGVWDSVETASFLEKNPNSNPAVPFSKDLGAN